MKKGRLKDKDVIDAAIWIMDGVTATEAARKKGVSVTTLIDAVTGKTKCYAHLQNSFNVAYVRALLRYNMGGRKLNPYAVQEARYRVSCGEPAYRVSRDIGKRLGVNPTTVYAAIRGETWAWVKKNPVPNGKSQNDTGLPARW